MTPADVPGAGTAEWLREYGPWALVVVCFSVIAFLFAALGKSRDAHAKVLADHTAEIKAINEAHKKEMSGIVDRLIETSTTQVREYHALAEKIALVVDSLTKRLGDRGSR
jgi:hypothetical protein